MSQKSLPKEVIVNHLMAFTRQLSVVALLCIALGVSAPGLPVGEPAWQSTGIVDTSASLYAKLHPVPIRAVSMGEGFWEARMRTNVEKSIPSMLQLLEEHGEVDNYLRLAGRSSASRRGRVSTDADIYKWIEAAAFALQSGDRPELRATVDKLIEDVLAAQEPSGYLNTYYVEDHAPLRFAEMYRSHELYCLGHLLQAAIAYYRATGDRRLLDGGIKYVNFLLDTFGPQKRPGLTGHPEFEMALVELYRTTGGRRYLDFAHYFLTGDGARLGLTDAQITYLFSGIPFTSRLEFVGHAVRALYASSGATDYFLETGDPAYRQTLDRLWQDLVDRKMYITGGVGSQSEHESFGPAYDLPNARAYAETCAAIASFMWNWRLLAASAQARYADVMERALYNGINSGMSLSGTLYCYTNPLESNGDREFRNPWYDTPCCLSNIERTFAALPGYFYSTSPAGVYVHFFHASTLNWHLENGTGLKLSQETNYPWGDAVTLKLNPAVPSTFSVFVRIPGWSRKTKVSVDGQPLAGLAKPGEYLEIHREWKPGDMVRVQFDMTPRLTVANPRVRDDVGKVAVERGPLVYCLEQVDLGAETSVFDVDLLQEGPDAGKAFRSEYHADLLGGIVILRHPGVVLRKPSSQEPLYTTFEMGDRASAENIDLTLIPYYAWGNRGRGPMEVWVPVVGSAGGAARRTSSR
jgi:DUF1680 family protein